VSAMSIKPMKRHGGKAKTQKEEDNEAKKTE
jgi:hypothetical protein